MLNFYKFILKVFALIKIFKIFKIIDVLRKYNGKFNGNTTRWTIAIEFLDSLKKDIEDMDYKFENGEFPAIKPKKVKVRIIF